MVPQGICGDELGQLRQGPKVFIVELLNGFFFIDISIESKTQISYTKA